MNDDELEELLNCCDDYGAAEIVVIIGGQHYLVSVMSLNTEEAMQELGCKYKH